MLKFGIALAVAALPMMMAAYSVKLLAEGLTEFNNVEWASLGKAALSLLGFGIAMIQLSKIAGPPMLIVGASLALFGLGLILFGKGLQEFNSVSLPAMGLALLGITVWGLAMIPLSAILTQGSLWVGAALMAFSVGLLLFGKGLQEFNNVSLSAMGKALLGITVWGIAMIPLGALLSAGSLWVGAALIAFSLGLILFGKGIQEFNDISLSAMGMAAAGLLGFGIAMAILTPIIAPASLLVGGALLVFAAGLILFGQGLQEFNDIGIGAILTAVFGLGLIFGILGGLSTCLLYTSPSPRDS